MGNIMLVIICLTGIVFSEHYKSTHNQYRLFDYYM